MWKKIFGNQKGVSLIEVTVASAVSIVVAMGVMKINENATKGMSKLQADSALRGDFRGELVRALSVRADCTAAVGAIDIDVPNSDLANITVNGRAFATVGQRLPTAQDFHVQDIVIEAFDNNGPDVAPNSGSKTGSCNIRFVLLNKKLHGDDVSKIRNFWIKTNCTVNDALETTPTIIQSCAVADNLKDDGHWVEVDVTGEIEFNGTGVGGPPRAKIGSGGAAFGGMTATLALDPNAGQFDASARLHGIEFPDDTSITFGLAQNGYLFFPAAGAFTIGSDSGSNLIIDADAGATNLTTNSALLDMNATTVDITSTGTALLAGTVTSITGSTSVGITSPGPVSLAATTAATVTGATVGITSTGTASLSGTVTSISGSTSTSVVGDAGASISSLTGNVVLSTGLGEFVRVSTNGVTADLHVLVGNTLRTDGAFQTASVGIFNSVISGAVGDSGTGTISAEDMYANNYNYISDERYKKLIETIKEPSVIISKLRGVTYYMRREEFPEKNFEERMQVGLIAQEVEAVLEELVTTGNDGFKSVKYANLVAVLIEAFKEQAIDIKKNKEKLKIMHNGFFVEHSEKNSRIEALELQNKKLREELDKVNDRLKDLSIKFSKVLKNI